MGELIVNVLSNENYEVQVRNMIANGDATVVDMMIGVVHVCKTLQSECQELKKVLEIQSEDIGTIKDKVFVIKNNPAMTSKINTAMRERHANVLGITRDKNGVKKMTLKAEMFDTYFRSQMSADLKAKYKIDRCADRGYIPEEEFDEAIRFIKTWKPSKKYVGQKLKEISSLRYKNRDLTDNEQRKLNAFEQLEAAIGDKVYDIEF